MVIDTQQAERAPGELPRESSDVRVVRSDGREVVVIGTAHVSRESAELVRRVIEEQRPDGVCIELDAGRYEALSHPERFEALDLREVIRKRQLATLGVQLVLAAYQRGLGEKLGVRPGAELLEGARVASELGVPLHLCDRDVRITLRRAWSALSYWKKSLLISTLLASVFERGEVTEEDLRELRRADVLSALLSELASAFPGLTLALIHERDVYLAERIRQSPGARLVAVVGAGHVAGLVRQLEAAERADLAPLELLPQPSALWRWLGASIPLSIVAALVLIGVRQGAAEVGENVLIWILACGVPAAIGALLSLAHPLTTLSAFLSAPITTLSPLIGVGHVTALVQAWLRPPLVRELGTVLDDALTPSGFWRNRVLRILLVFVLTTLGTVLGSWVGGVRIFANLVSG